MVARQETRPRDFAQAFALCLRQLTQTPSGATATEANAYALLEQFILLRWLEEKDWLGFGNNTFPSQLLRHYEADPESTSFYTAIVTPRLRVLESAQLLSVESGSAMVAINEVCKFIFDTLLAPFRFEMVPSRKTESDKHIVTVDLTFAQIYRGVYDTGQTAARRTAPNSALPSEIARWMCRASLISFLSIQLEETGRLAPSEGKERLTQFFELPRIALMTDAQIADIHQLFLRTEIQCLSRSLLQCRVCDPASGNGVLLAAMLEEMADALAKLDVALYGRAIIEQHNYEFRLKRQLVNESLYGLDSHPAAVRLTRQHLWLALVAADQSCPDASLAVTMREAATAPGLTEHLICGDALLACRAFEENETTNLSDAFRWRKAFPEVFAARGGFDLILGYTPTRGTSDKAREKSQWTQWCAIFPQLKRAKNIAAAYFDLPRMIGAPQALACHAVPRALTLAEGWAAARAGLRLNYDLLLDVTASEHFNDPRLEQEVFLYRRESGLNETHVEISLPAPLETPLVAVNETPVAASTSALIAPQHLNATGIELHDRLVTLRTLNDIAVIKRGQRWQRRNTKASKQMTVPLIANANLRSFHLTDELSRQEPPAYIQRVLEELRQPKLVVSPMLQFLKKPYDTLILLAALDRQGSVALESVIQIFPHTDSPFSLELLCALLNSTFARWYFHFVLFQRPARAVECSPQELGRLPLPHRPKTTTVTQVERLTRKLCKMDLPGKYLLPGQMAEYDKLDELVCELYGLSEEERAEILRQQ